MIIINESFNKKIKKREKGRRRKKMRKREQNLIKFLKCKNCGVKCCVYKRVGVFITRTQIK